MRKKWGSGLLARKSHSAYKTRPAEKTLFLAKFAKNAMTSREPVHIYEGGVFAKTAWIESHLAEHPRISNQLNIEFT